MWTTITKCQVVPMQQIWETQEAFSTQTRICFVTKSEDLLDNELGTLMTSVMGYYLADQLPNFKHEDVPKIVHDPYKYC